MNGIDELKKFMKMNGSPSVFPKPETCLANLEDELNSCDQRTKRFNCFVGYMSCVEGLFLKTSVSNFNGTDLMILKFDDVRKCKNLLKKCI